MKKILCLLFIISFFSFFVFSQSEKKLVQITAPNGYRVYLNSEFKGITNTEMDGLFFYTELNLGKLEIKKQDKTIVNINLSIDKTIEFNLYNYLTLNPIKNEYDYWKELFSILDYKHGTVYDYKSRRFVFDVSSSINKEAEVFLENLSSNKLEYPIVFDNDFRKGFYYGKIIDGNSILGKRVAFFVLFFVYSSSYDKYDAFLRVETSGRDMEAFVNSSDRNTILQELNNLNQNNTFYYLYSTLNDFKFYPKLGFLSMVFKVNYDTNIRLSFSIIDNEMIFDWTKTSVKDFQSLGKDPSKVQKNNNRVIGDLYFKEL